VSITVVGKNEFPYSAFWPDVRMVPQWLTPVRRRGPSPFRDPNRRPSLKLSDILHPGFRPGTTASCHAVDIRLTDARMPTISPLGFTREGPLRISATDAPE
jgi:hypothetical protein